MKRFVGATAAFIFSKASVFLAPLLLSNLLTVNEYGIFEYALALAGLIAMPLAAGMHGSVSYFLLHRGRVGFAPLFPIHVLAISALSFVVASVAALLQVPLQYCMAIALSGVLASQFIYAAWAKTNGRPALSSTIESGLYLLLLGLAGLMTARLVPAHAEGLLVLVLAYLVFWGAFSLRRALRAQGRPKFFRRYRVALKYGLGLIGASLITLLLVSSGRLLLGQLMSMADVGIYSFFFRMAAPAVLLHQLLSTYLFRSLYTARPEVLDKYIAGVLLLITLVSVSGFFTLPMVLASHFHYFELMTKDQKLVYWTLSFQMVFWVALAQMEPIINREGLSLPLVPWLAGLTLALAATLVVIHRVQGTNLVQICQFHMAALFIGFLIQVWLVRGVSIRLKLAPIVTIATLFVWAGGYLLLK